MIDRDYIPVAPVWERKPDDPDIWRRVTVLPTLALNKAEMEFLGAVPGKRLAVLGSGDGIIPLALAAMGAKVTVLDPTSSGLDVLLVRTQIVGVELDYRQIELTDLSALGGAWCEIAYAGQVAGSLKDLGRFYNEVYKMLVPGGRLVVNEYHPFRRIFKQEPGQPRVGRSYFERHRLRTQDDEKEDVTSIGRVSERYEYYWTLADHFYFLTRVGFKVIGIEEVGDARQHWEMPNLTGMPEQVVFAADKLEK